MVSASKVPLPAGQSLCLCLAELEAVPGGRGRSFPGALRERPGSGRVQRGAKREDER